MTSAFRFLFLVDRRKLETHALRMNVTLTSSSSPPPHSSIHPVVSWQFLEQPRLLPSRSTWQNGRKKLPSFWELPELSLLRYKLFRDSHVPRIPNSLSVPCTWKSNPKFPWEFSLEFCKTIVTGIFALCSARSILAILRFGTLRNLLVVVTSSSLTCCKHCLEDR